MRLATIAFCENGLSVILGYEVEDLSTAFASKIPPIAYWVAPKLQNVVERYVAGCNG